MRAGLLLLAALLLAGCTAQGEDPFAYTRKPLYTGGFDLAKLDGGEETQQFRVGDGSIGAIRLQIWVNATEGGATVTILDPSGRVVLTTDSTRETSVPVNLGAWTVKIQGQPNSSGHVGILVTRG